MEIIEIYKAVSICHNMGLCDGYKAKEEIIYLLNKIEEHEHLAKIGKATERWFKTNAVEEFNDIDELLDWAVEND